MAEADLAAVAPPPPTPLQVIRENFNRLSSRQKMAGAAALALSLALLMGVWLWSRQPTYAILFSGLSEKDGGAIVTALQAQNIPYKVSEQGTSIMVPAQQAAELRLRMASQGLPKGGHVGFELMENERIGLSQFSEQVNYQRALEGELARTISALSAVEDARVHLAIPKQTAFLRDEQKPTASVVLTLRGGRVLDSAQVAGVVHLVASSVPELTADAVSVLDQNGKLLTMKSDALRQAGLDSSQLKYVHDIEEGLVERINAILEPVVGPDNMRAQVTADVDFDQQEQTAETYGPNPVPKQSIRSQQTADSTTLQPAPQGVPGALSNQPPVPASAPLTTPAVPGAGGTANGAQPLSINKSATTNYELDKTVQHVKKSLGQIKRLSVAVVVNHHTDRDNKGNLRTTPLTEEQMKQINDLVREAVGYNDKRGDTLNIANAPFNVPIKTETSVSLLKDPELRALAMAILPYLAFLLVLALVWLGVLRPLVRTVMPQPVEEASEAVAEGGTAEEGEGAEAMEDQEIRDEDLLPPEVRIEEIARLSFEKKLQKARELAMKNPRAVANLLKEWMGSVQNVEQR